MSEHQWELALEPVDHLASIGVGLDRRQRLVAARTSAVAGLEVAALAEGQREHFELAEQAASKSGAVEVQTQHWQAAVEAASRPVESAKVAVLEHCS